MIARQLPSLVHTVRPAVIEVAFRSGRVTFTIVVVVGFSGVEVVATAVAAAESGGLSRVAIRCLRAGTLAQRLVEVGGVEDAAVAALVGGFGAIAGREVSGLGCACPSWR